MSAASGESDAVRRTRLELFARLVPSIVHASNNALGALRGTVELLAAGRTGDRAGFALEQIDRVGDSLAALSRLAREAPDDTLASFDLGEALDRALVLVGPFAEEGRVDLRRIEDVRGILRGPADLLVRHLVLELSRAVDRAPAASRARISVHERRRGGCVLRGVAFLRETPERDAPGWDGGLADSGREVAARFDGAYRARALGRVRAWSLELPCASFPDGDPARRRAGTILLVAPPGEEAELCALVLEQEGYEVIPCRDPAETLRSPDLVILDDTLAADPELLARVSALCAAGTLPLLELTSGGVRPRAGDGLPKPFGPGDLLERVGRLLGR